MSCEGLAATRGRHVDSLVRAREHSEPHNNWAWAGGGRDDRFGEGREAKLATNGRGRCGGAGRRNRACSLLSTRAHRTHNRAAGGAPVPGSTGRCRPRPGCQSVVPVVSPDGRRVAFSASRPGEPVRIWVRSLESLDARSLSGTDNARGQFWSPDSRTLAFFAEGKLKTIDAAGGPAQTVCK